MIKAIIIGVIALVAAAFVAGSPSYGQTATTAPTASPTTSSPSPTGSVKGTSTTVPSGAPSTGMAAN